VPDAPGMTRKSMIINRGPFTTHMAAFSARRDPGSPGQSHKYGGVL
jgi:hypothetical protein